MHELSYKEAQDALDDERGVILDLLRPYFLVHFRDLRFNRSATPLDYGFISHDPEFLNLADYRLQNHKQNSHPALQRAIPRIRALRAAIGNELAG